MKQFKDKHCLTTRPLLWSFLVVGWWVFPFLSLICSNVSTCSFPCLWRIGSFALLWFICPLKPPQRRSEKPKISMLDAKPGFQFLIIQRNWQLTSPQETLISGTNSSELAIFVQGWEFPVTVCCVHQWWDGSHRWDAQVLGDWSLSSKYDMYSFSEGSVEPQVDKNMKNLAYSKHMPLLLQEHHSQLHKKQPNEWQVSPQIWCSALHEVLSLESQHYPA